MIAREKNNRIVGKKRQFPPPIVLTGGATKRITNRVWNNFGKYSSYATVAEQVMKYFVV